MFYQFQHFGVSEYFIKEYGKDFSFPNHLHQSFELITVLSGEMTVNVDECSYTLTCGDAILIFPHQLHSLQGQACEHMLCIFSPETVKAYNSKLHWKIPKNNKFTPDKYLLDSLNRISAESSIIEKKGVLYSLCASFDRNAEYTEKTRDDKKLLYNIFQFVEANYMKDCSLEELARKTGFSYSYLSRYFKSIVNISFNSYVNQYRIGKACYFLTNSDCSVLQCAYECGYTSLRSFNRNFKIYLSLTPQAYRKIQQDMLKKP